MANISVGPLDRDRYQISIGGSELAIRESSGRLLAMVKRSDSRLYLLFMELSMAACLVSHGKDKAWRWHERLGYLKFSVMKKLAHEDLIRCLLMIAPVERSCEACQVGKQRRTPFLVQTQYWADVVLELMHGDLCGKISPPTPASN
jgi:hypothetical protein